MSLADWEQILYKLTLIQLSIHNTKNPPYNSLIDEVVPVHRLAHSPMVRLEANLLNLVRQVEEGRVPLYHHSTYSATMHHRPSGFRGTYRILQHSHWQKIVKAVDVDSAEHDPRQPSQLEEVTAVARQILDDMICWAGEKCLHHAADNVREAGEVAALVRGPEEEDPAYALCQCLVASIRGKMNELDQAVSAQSKNVSNCSNKSDCTSLITLPSSK